MEGILRPSEKPATVGSNQLSLPSRVDTMVNMERATGGLKKIVLDAIRSSRPEDAALIAWPVIVGRAVASETKALDFNNGVLRVEVPDKTWRAQLLSFLPQYVAAYRQVAKVETIELVIAGERSRREPDKV